MPRRDFPQLQRYLLWRHILFAQDAEEADYRLTCEPKLSAKLRRAGFGLGTRLVGDGVSL